MSTELSPEQQRAIAACPDGPVEAVDPVTKRTYVLVSEQLFKHLQANSSDEEDAVRSMQGLLAELAPEDWEDASFYDEPRT